MPRGVKDTAQVQLSARRLFILRTRCDVDAACSTCGTDAVDNNALVRGCREAVRASRGATKQVVRTHSNPATFLARQDA